MFGAAGLICILCGAEGTALRWRSSPFLLKLGSHRKVWRFTLPGRNVTECSDSSRKFCHGSLVGSAAARNWRTSPSVASCTFFGDSGRVGLDLFTIDRTKF